VSVRKKPSPAVLTNAMLANAMLANLSGVFWLALAGMLYGLWRLARGEQPFPEDG
jgi:hypothetical protein